MCRCGQEALTITHHLRCVTAKRLRSTQALTTPLSELARISPQYRAPPNMCGARALVHGDIVDSGCAAKRCCTGFMSHHHLATLLALGLMVPERPMSQRVRHLNVNGSGDSCPGHRATGPSDRNAMKRPLRSSQGWTFHKHAETENFEPHRSVRTVPSRLPSRVVKLGHMQPVPTFLESLQNLI